MPFAETPTTLSLERFAQIIGVNPVHFAGGAGSEVWPTSVHCGQVWPQYTWQVPDNIVSREELAIAIRSAEDDIARVLGYPPGLTWAGPETISLISFWNPGVAFRNWLTTGDGTARLIKLQHGEIRAGGQETPVTTYGPLRPVTYLDVDGDTYAEVARFANPETDPTVKPDLRNWRFFLPDQDALAAEIGDPVEIRGARIRTIAGLHYVEFDAWQLFRKQLLTATPILSGFSPVAIDQPGSYVTGLYAVKDEGNDLPAARVRWTQGHICGQSACPACASTTADGCLAIADSHLGLVYPVLGSCVDGVWTQNEVCACGNPSEMTVWYRAGLTSKVYEAGNTQDPLDPYWAQTIAFLAAARLEKPVCGCTNVQTVMTELRRDLALADGNDNIPNTDFELLGNPFGTRVGEVKAWRRTMHFANQQVMDSGVI